jgi:ZIP family zinc transporter
VALLGAIAGLTIFLGLPVGRLRNLSTETRAFLNAAATGVLLFLLIDVLSHANEPIEDALTAASDGDGSWARFVWLAFVGLVGFGVGLLSLVYYERWIARSTRRVGEGPGAALASDVRRDTWTTSGPHRLALLIAMGIGLHNFAEGLAIGQSASASTTRPRVSASSRRSPWRANARAGRSWACSA